MSEPERRQCGLCYQMTLTLNPHPMAGQLYLDAEGRPTQGGPYVTAVGSVWECIPCLLQNVHRRAQREARLRTVISALTAGLGNWQGVTLSPELAAALLAAENALDGVEVVEAKP